MCSENNLQQSQNQDCTHSEDNTENVKFAYGKAIDAYNEHRRSYQAWVNLYAIFTGAFFIALYSTMAWDSDDRHWFTILISLLGLFTSICWLASVVGYYAWMKSWIEVVKSLEEELFDEEIPKWLAMILSALSPLIIYFCSGKLFSSSLGTN